MANLIIKSSADNLVLQGSDASPAITVGATGTTTFAENATFSGTANNLGTTTAGTLTSGVTFPAGHVVQVVFSSFDPSNLTSSSTSYQSTSIFADIQKKFSSSRCLVTIAGGHMYVGASYPDGCASTICQQSSTTSFTHSTTYSASDDPASTELFGMQQVYNNSLNSTSHSKQFLFTSSDKEFESFRVFFKSRGGASVTIHETNHRVSITIMEIKQ